jgi:DNA-binding transcriptional LysR family regulator
MQRQNLRGLDLNLLVPLRALLEERSVTRAAMRVHLSQPAMSRAFERLREAFSDDLLIRSGKKYALTPRAAALLEELTLLLPKVESLWQTKPFSPATATRSLKLAMTDQMTILLLPELVATLSREAPNVDVQLVPWQDSSFRDLAAGQLDLVVCASGEIRLSRITQSSTQEEVILANGISGRKAHRFGGATWTANIGGWAPVRAWKTPQGCLASALLRPRCRGSRKNVASSYDSRTLSQQKNGSAEDATGGSSQRDSAVLSDDELVRPAQYRSAPLLVSRLSSRGL